MIFELCISLIITFSYYAYQFVNRKKKSSSLENKKAFLNKKSVSINNGEMSDDEFASPLKAMEHWKKSNVKNTPIGQKTGIFRWKRSRDEPQETENAKRQKYQTPPVQSKPSDVILLSSDEESESNISEDSITGLATSNVVINGSGNQNNTRSILKDMSSQDNSQIEVYDVDTQETTFVKIEIPDHSKFTDNSIPEAINSCFKNIDIEKNVCCNQSSSCKDVPNPPGMPPMISGVPVRFPVTPYRSQISVMNAVIKGCKNKEHCLLESPTGSGKTLALLCAALAWQEQFKANAAAAAELAKSTSDFNIENGNGVPGTVRANQAQGKASSSKQSEFEENDKQKEIEEPEDEEYDFEGKKTKQKRLPKIYYGSRTHKQIEQVIREFKKTAYTHKPMTILSSRELTCIQGTKQGVSKTQLCNDLRDPRKRTSCPYYNDKNKNYMASHPRLQSLGMESPWDIEDLVQLGRNNGCCPYFSARSLMEEAEIIFCPYNYLIDPVIRDTMAINLTGDIVIVDEAHNMEGICRDVGSNNFREDHLAEAIDDCIAVMEDNTKFKPSASHKANVPDNTCYSVIKHYLSGVLEIIHEQHLRDPSNVWEEVTSDCWSGVQAWQMFKMHNLTDRHYTLFKNACQTAINQYKAVMEDLQSQERKIPLNGTTAINFNTKRLIEELMNSLECIKSPELGQDYRCTVTRSRQNDAKIKNPTDGWVRAPKPLQMNTFKFICMNSAIVFGVVARQARSVILASGTLSPTMTFESELGTNFAQKLSANHVVPKDQVYVRGISHGPSGTVLRATYQNVQTYPFKDDLGKLLVQVCQTVPFGVLCFFSSYSMMTSQIERWQETGAWNEMERRKLVVQEPRSNNELDEVMYRYREAIHNSRFRSQRGITGALLLAVFRGKVAEGIDFSDNEARCVISIGIPYAVQTDPVIKLKREYNDSNRSKGLLSGSDWYSVQAFRALNQALGRCIRHKNDWGAVLLIDERLNNTNNTLWTNYLPKWIREMKLEGSNYDLKEELKVFVKNQELRDEERAHEE